MCFMSTQVCFGPEQASRRHEKERGAVLGLLACWPCISVTCVSMHTHCWRAHRLLECTYTWRAHRLLVCTQTVGERTDYALVCGIFTTGRTILITPALQLQMWELRLPVLHVLPPPHKVIQCQLASPRNPPLVCCQPLQGGVGAGSPGDGQEPPCPPKRLSVLPMTSSSALCDRGNPIHRVLSLRK